MQEHGDARTDNSSHFGAYIETQLPDHVLSTCDSRNRMIQSTQTKLGLRKKKPTNASDLFDRISVWAFGTAHLIHNLAARICVQRYFYIYVSVYIDIPRWIVAKEIFWGGQTDKTETKSLWEKMSVVSSLM